MNKGTGTRW